MRWTEYSIRLGLYYSPFFPAVQLSICALPVIDLRWKGWRGIEKVRPYEWSILVDETEKLKLPVGYNHSQTRKLASYWLQLTCNFSFSLLNTI